MEQDVKTQQDTAQEPQLPSIHLGNENPLFSTSQYDQLMKVAELFAASKIVPKDFQGSKENCAIVIATAMRLHLDPYMFLQNTYVVSGRPGMMGQLLIAILNTSGMFTPLTWKFEGDEFTDSYRCTCSAVRKSTGEVCETTVTWRTVKREHWDQNIKWMSMPEQMFCYRSAAFFARRHCPEILIGFVTNEELDDMRTVETTGREIPPAPQDPDEAPRVEPKKSMAVEGAVNPPAAAAATDAEGPPSADMPEAWRSAPAPAEAPSATDEVPPAPKKNGNGKPAANGGLIGTTEASEFWPAYRRRHNRDEKPLRAWLEAHGYTSSKDVKKTDFPMLMKDLTT